MSAQEDYLRGIADAIREKDGTSEPIKATDFAARIRAIVGNKESYTATSGAYQEQRLAEIAEAIRAADRSADQIPAETFAERIRALKLKSWVDECVEEAMAKLDGMLDDVPMDTPKGQEQYIEFFMAPWLFAEYSPTQTGGDVDSFVKIYDSALADIGGIFDEAGISMYIIDAKVQANRSVDVTMAVNGEMFEWNTLPVYSKLYRFYQILVQTVGEDLIDQIYTLIANASEFIKAGYQMMNDVYGYDEQ